MEALLCKPWLASPRALISMGLLGTVLGAEMRLSDVEQIQVARCSFSLNAMSCRTAVNQLRPVGIWAPLQQSARSESTTANDSLFVVVRWPRRSLSPSSSALRSLAASASG